MTSIDNFPYIPFDQMMKEIAEQEQAIRVRLHVRGVPKKYVEEIMEMISKLTAMESIADEEART